MTALALAAVVLVPAASGIALCLAGRRATRVAVPVSLSAAALTAALSIIAAITRPTIEMPFLAGVPASIAVDDLSALMLPAVAIVALLVLIFAAAEGTESPARFHGLMLIFVAAVAVTVTATTLPTLLFAWEIMGAMSWALIGFNWRDERRVQAGLVAFAMTRTGDLGLYLAAGAALVAGGLSGTGGSGLAIASLSDAASPWRDAIAAGIVVAALGKAAQLPFSSWLSRAMEGPSSVSALLHSAAMVAMGGYLLLRVSPLLEATGWAGPAVAWIGMITALLLGAVAVAQRDLKQLLAASTAAQLGFVVLAAGVGAIAGGASYLVGHAATKALLFLVAGAWLAALGTKQLSSLRGAARRWPVVGVLFTVGALSLAGVAPLSLWALKDELLAVVLESSPALYAAGLVAAALSAAYSAKALVLVWSRADAAVEAGFDTEVQGTRRIPGLTRLPLVVLAGGAAVLGILALPPIRRPLEVAVGGAAAPTTALELIGSAALALGVVALVLRGGQRRGKTPSLVESAPSRWVSGWLGLETAIRVVVVRPTLALGGLLARFDDAVVDGGVWRAAGASLRVARGLGRFDDAGLDAAITQTARAGSRWADRAALADIRGVDGIVEGVARVLRRLGELARRPQTGLIHQYYAQIAVAGVVLFVLVLLVR